MSNITVIKPAGSFALPALTEISEALPALIQACAGAGNFATPTTTTVVFE
ncbi:MAG: hypothetical protein WDM96_13740 [Lacunisphaera sp.]